LWRFCRSLVAYRSCPTGNVWSPQSTPVESGTVLQKLLRQPHGPLLLVMRSSSLCSGAADGTASSCKTQKEAHQPQLSVSTDGMASILVFRAASMVASACCRRSLGTLVEAMPSLIQSTSCATTGRLLAVNRFRGLKVAIFEAEEGQMFLVRSRSVWLCWMG
jgi:hypothetical protein